MWIYADFDTKRCGVNAPSFRRVRVTVGITAEFVFVTTTGRRQVTANKITPATAKTLASSSGAAAVTAATLKNPKARFS